MSESQDTFYYFHPWFACSPKYLLLALKVSPVLNFFPLSAFASQSGGKFVGAGGKVATINSFKYLCLNKLQQCFYLNIWCHSGVATEPAQLSVPVFCILNIPTNCFCSVLFAWQAVGKNERSLCWLGVNGRDRIILWQSLASNAQSMPSRPVNGC